jgi:hypothetical protein
VLYIGGVIGYGLRESHTVRLAFVGGKMTAYMKAYLVVRYIVIDSLIFPYTGLKGLLM